MSVYLVAITPKDPIQDNMKLRDAIKNHHKSNDGWNYIALSDFSYLIETTLPLSDMRPQFGLSICSEDILHIFDLYGTSFHSDNEEVKKWINVRADQIGRVHEPPQDQ